MNRSPLRAAIARIPCDSPRSVTAAPAAATCCANGIEARASGSGLGVSAEAAGGDDLAGSSARLSAIAIVAGAGKVHSGGAAARAGDQSSIAITIKRRIETSVARGLTIVVRFANGEHLDPWLSSARLQTAKSGAEDPASRALWSRSDALWSSAAARARQSRGPHLFLCWSRRRIRRHRRPRSKPSACTQDPVLRKLPAQ